MARILTGGGKDGSGNPTTAVVGRPGFGRQTRTLRQSADVVAKTDPSDAYLNTPIQDVPKVGTVKATLTTALTGTNNDLVFTAKRGGASFNSVRVRYVDPATPNATQSISVSGNDITVNLATNATPAITSTAAQILAAINADASASKLVTASLAASNDGTGVVTALAYTNLSGGTSGETRKGSPPGTAPAPSTPTKLQSPTQKLTPTVRLPNRRQGIRIR
jgi:hypothetical protein